MKTLREQIEDFKAKRRDEIIKEVAEAELREELNGEILTPSPTLAPAITESKPRRTRRTFPGPRYNKFTKVTAIYKPPLKPIAVGSLAWKVYEKCGELLQTGPATRSELERIIVKDLGLARAQVSGTMSKLFTSGTLVAEVASEVPAPSVLFPAPVMPRAPAPPVPQPPYRRL